MICTKCMQQDCVCPIVAEHKQEPSPDKLAELQNKAIAAARTESLGIGYDLAKLDILKLINARAKRCKALGLTIAGDVVQSLSREVEGMEP